MEVARYGRMRLGRCVKNDLGYVGCFSDVIQILDSKCSGILNIYIYCFKICAYLRKATNPLSSSLSSYRQSLLFCGFLLTSSSLQVDMSVNWLYPIQILTSFSPASKISNLTLRLPTNVFQVSVICGNLRDILLLCLMAQHDQMTQEIK